MIESKDAVDLDLQGPWSQDICGVLGGRREEKAVDRGRLDVFIRQKRSKRDCRKGGMANCFWKGSPVAPDNGIKGLSVR